MFGVPRPEHSAIAYIGIFCYYITLYNMSFKTIPVGLMVLFDGMVHFLKIEKNVNKSTKTMYCGFNISH